MFDLILGYIQDYYQSKCSDKELLDRYFRYVSYWMKHSPKKSQTNFHHIVPRECELKFQNNKDNLVEIPLNVHYFLHVAIVPGLFPENSIERYKMLCAARIMSKGEALKGRSLLQKCNLYQKFQTDARRNAVRLNMGRLNPNFGKTWKWIYSNDGRNSLVPTRLIENGLPDGWIFGKMPGNEYVRYDKLDELKENQQTRRNDTEMNNHNYTIRINGFEFSTTSEESWMKVILNVANGQGINSLSSLNRQNPMQANRNPKSNYGLSEKYREAMGLVGIAVPEKISDMVVPVGKKISDIAEEEQCLYKMYAAKGTIIWHIEKGGVPKDRITVKMIADQILKEDRYRDILDKCLENFPKGVEE